MTNREFRNREYNRLFLAAQHVKAQIEVLDCGTDIGRVARLRAIARMARSLSIDARRAENELRKQLQRDPLELGA